MKEISETVHPGYMLEIGICLSLILVLLGCRERVPPKPTVPPEPHMQKLIQKDGSSSKEDASLSHI